MLIGRETKGDVTESPKQCNCEYQIRFQTAQSMVEILNIFFVFALQDLMVLLDLIGSKNTRFVDWFPQTSRYFSKLQNIGG
jgi:hypothetical protein